MLTLAISISRALQQEQQQLLPHHRDTYLDSRANDVQSIESTINEIGEMYQKMATMISQQNESVIR